MADYVLVIATAAVVTYLLTFAVRRVALARGVVVEPDDRRVHARPTPTVGGAAMVGAFTVAMGLASLLPYFRPVFARSSEPLGVVIAGLVIFIVGMVDDLRDVSPPAKIAGQILAATVLYYTGVTMYSIKIPFFHQIVVLSPSVTPLLTAVWVVGIANAINLIDGLDGLAAGIAGIAAIAFTTYSLQLEHLGLLSNDSLGPLIAAIVAGVCAGFLPHNFHPAKIFMGDAGAMFLGLLLAASTSVVGGRTGEVSGHTYFFFVPLMIPLFILGVPMVDTVFAVVRRTARRSGVATADKSHLHHRLLQMGHGHVRSVLILWSWTAILSGFVLYPLFAHGGNAVIPFATAGLGVVLYTLFRPGVRRQPRRRGRHGDRGQSRKPVVVIDEAGQDGSTRALMSAPGETSAGTGG